MSRFTFLPTGMCFFCWLAYSLNLMRIGYDPTPEDLQAMTEMYKRVEIISQQEVNFSALQNNIKKLEANAKTPRQEYYAEVAKQMVEYVKM